MTGPWLLFTGCAGPNGHYTGSVDQTGHRRFEFIRPVMGMPARIVFFAADEQSANTAANEAFNRLRELDEALSDWKSDSELMRLSAQAGGPPVKVGGDLFAVLKASARFHDLSDGAFDPTVGPIVRLWRTARERHEMPDVDALVEALDRVGWSHVQLDETKRTVSLARPNMQLDLGGIGKGYAGDAVAALLREKGIESFLLDLGGDLILGDPPPDELGWKVRLETTGELLTLSRMAIATSGDTEQFVEIDGKRFSHLVNPRTGLGLTHRLQVTVLAPDGTSADALASAVSVLGRERGAALLDSLARTAGVIAGPNERDDFVITRTGRFIALTQSR